MSLRKFRPSNGTEGMIFVENFCDHCKHEKFCHTNNDNDKKCDILTNSMMHNVDEPEYPAELIYGDDGQPTCTKYIYRQWTDEDGQMLEEFINEEEETVDPAQLDIFGATGTKLLPVIDFVLEQEKTLGKEESVSFKGFTRSVCKIANFAKRPLEMWMLFACDKNGLPYTEERLERIKDSKNDTMQSAIEWKNLLEVDLPEARAKVLFAGFTVTEEDGTFYLTKDDLELEYKKHLDIWVHNGEDVYWDIDGLARFAENICSDIYLTATALKELQ
jgi:hypothetical protein